MSDIPQKKRILTPTVRYCPPGESEERDPGWERDKPRERAGFRELDEYEDWLDYWGDPKRREFGFDENYEKGVTRLDRWDFTGDSDDGDTEDGGRESE